MPIIDLSPRDDKLLEYYTNLVKRQPQARTPYGVLAKGVSGLALGYQQAKAAQADKSRREALAGILSGAGSYEDKMSQYATVAPDKAAPFLFDALRNREQREYDAGEISKQQAYQERIAKEAEGRRLQRLQQEYTLKGDLAEDDRFSAVAAARRKRAQDIADREDKQKHDMALQGLRNEGRVSGRKLGGGGLAPEQVDSMAEMVSAQTGYSLDKSRAIVLSNPNYSAATLLAETRKRPVTQEDPVSGEGYYIDPLGNKVVTKAAPANKESLRLANKAFEEYGNKLKARADFGRNQSNRLEIALATAAKTGKMEPVDQFFKEIAESTGLVTGASTPTKLLDAISSGLVVDVLGEQKGTQTKEDADRIEKMFPNIKTSPHAKRAIAESILALRARENLEYGLYKKYDRSTRGKAKSRNQTDYDDFLESQLESRPFAGQGADNLPVYYDLWEEKFVDTHADAVDRKRAKLITDGASPAEADSAIREGLAKEFRSRFPWQQ